jgi:hypothetical protein
MLHPQPAFASEPKEYNLFATAPEKLRSRKPGQAFIFSEKDLPGYKPKSFAWDDVDEDGNPGQGRSYLYERHKREQKKKENKGRFVPYTRRPIPKQTAITGTIVREFETVPVKNDEFYVLEGKQTAEMLKVRAQEEALFKTGDDNPETLNRNIYTSRAEAQAAAKVCAPSISAAYLSVRAGKQTLTHCFPNRPTKPANMLQRKIALRVSTNMFSLTSSSICSASTASGACATSKPESISPRLTCAKLSPKLHLCGNRAISTANGSCKMPTSRTMRLFSILLVSKSHRKPRTRTQTQSLVWISMMTTTTRFSKMSASRSRCMILGFGGFRS